MAGVPELPRWQDWLGEYFHDRQTNLQRPSTSDLTVTASDDELRDGLHASSLARTQNLLLRWGVCAIVGDNGKPVIQAERLERVKEACGAAFNECANALLVKQSLGSTVAAAAKFREVVERDGGRFDCKHRMDEILDDGLCASALWRSAIDSVLGVGSHVVQAKGNVVALSAKQIVGNYVARKPDASAESEGFGWQAWHSDSPHVHSWTHQPPHCLTVFIPMTDVSPRNGSTEFLPGSHILGSSYEKSDGGVAFTLPFGSVVIFDVRILHRGGPNLAKWDRHLAYVTYAKPWFKDHRNFTATESLFGRVSDQAPRCAGGRAEQEDDGGGDPALEIEIEIAVGEGADDDEVIRGKIAIARNGAIGDAVNEFCEVRGYPRVVAEAIQNHVQQQLAAAGLSVDAEGRLITG